MIKTRAQSAIQLCQAYLSAARLLVGYSPSVEGQEETYNKVLEMRAKPVPATMQESHTRRRLHSPG